MQSTGHAICVCILPYRLSGRDWCNSHFVMFFLLICQWKALDVIAHAHTLPNSPAGSEGKTNAIKLNKTVGKKRL